MVQNKPINTNNRTRGRPKAYDRPTALKSLRNVFWRNGFAGTSLEAMSEATAMNRPSLYNAFGDKAEAFRTVMQDYVVDLRRLYTEAFTADLPLAEGLARIYGVALDIYRQEDGVGRGCFLSGAALTDSLRDPVVAAQILAALHELDGAFKRRLLRAQACGELSADADIDALTSVASVTHNALSIRVRAGESPEAVRQMIAHSIHVICTNGRLRLAYTSLNVSYSIKIDHI